MKLMPIVFLFAFSAQASTWDETNDPRKFDTNYEYNLKNLPLKSQLPADKTPWSSSYWPRHKGSLNYRWNTSNPTGFKLVSPGRARVMQMSNEQLAELSPAEKFDLAQGHYDYPLSSAIAANVTPKAKYYEGICDGWTASSLQFEEPKPTTITNPDGVKIPFGTSDIKGLASYDVSINQSSEELGSVFIGDYCLSGIGLRLGTGRCQDINPGSFHVILANQIGLKKQPFGVDLDTTRETWNHPVFGFEFKIQGSAKKQEDRAARAVMVHAKMWVGQDDPDEEADKKKVFHWNPAIGTENFTFMVKEYDYVLELDYADRIIGGYWTGDSTGSHPDLFWMPTNKIEFKGEFELLNKLIKSRF